jgi:hypothetical protein
VKQTLFQEKYPVFEAEITKDETDHRSVEEIVAYFRERIAENAKATFIGVFDPYAHTQAIDGEIGPGLTAAVDVIFCFGNTLPSPHVLAVRPRSIGIADTGDAFVVSFLEAPMALANDIMESWVRDLRRTPVTV